MPRDRLGILLDSLEEKTTASRYYEYSRTTSIATSNKRARVGGLCSYSGRLDAVRYLYIR